MKHVLESFFDVPKFRGIALFYIKDQSLEQSLNKKYL